MIIFKYHLLIFLIILISCAQKITRNNKTTSAANQTEHPSSAKFAECSNTASYIPDTIYPTHTPIKYLNINIHYIYPTNTNDKFSKEEGITFAQSLVMAANERLQNNVKMNLPIGNETPIIPVRIQYALDGSPDQPDDPGVYFHYDDSLAYFNKKLNSNRFSQSIYEKYGIDKDNKLNIFILEHYSDSISSPTYKASGDGVGFGDFVKITNAYKLSRDTFYQKDGSYKLGEPWQLAGILNHEIGHSLSLQHTWRSNDGCDDTPQHPNCWEAGSYPCDIISNNVMDYNNCQCAYTPCQIGKIHYYLSEIKPSFQVPYWCKYYPEHRIVITDSVQWKNHKRLISDVIIEANAQLTVSCTVSLPKEAKIVIKPGGKLILDQCLLTNECSDQWQGIEVQKKGKLKGEVIFIGNATIENAINNINPRRQLR